MRVGISSLTIQGSRVEGENPLPMLCDRQRDHKPELVRDSDWSDETLTLYGEDNGFQVLPYRIQDRYPRNLAWRQYKLIVLENDRLRAEFLPEFGGKIYSLVDKRSGRDLIFRAPVLRIVNIAARGAWTAGGIEWNLGLHMHTYFAASPVYMAALQDDAGNEFVRIYEYERLRGFFFQLDIHLPPGASALFTHGRVVNDTCRDMRFDWWTNMGIREEPDMRVLAGADTVAYLHPIEDRDTEFFPYRFGYCSLEEMNRRLGFDGSYPERFPFAGEYFLQSPESVRAPWLAAVYPDGFLFFNRSTNVTRNKKMYTWGRHGAGLNWRDYLFDKNLGNHIEVQSGMAVSQTHTTILKAGDTREWTECFACGTAGDLDAIHDADLARAREAAYHGVDEVITEETIYDRDRQFRLLVDQPPGEILAIGSGFGAIERIRRERGGLAMPRGMIFPVASLGAAELPWLNLMEQGVLEEIPTHELPASWMAHDAHFRKLLTASIETKAGLNYSALNQLGVMLYEDYEFDEAIRTWEDSAALKPNAIAYRNLARAHEAAGRAHLAEENMKRAIECGGLDMDPAFAEEYLDLLIRRSRFRDAWELYQGLDESRRTDKARLLAGLAAVHTGNEDFVETLFGRQFGHIREYENDYLTARIWYRYTALKEAERRGIACTDELLREIMDSREPPGEWDFRVVP